MNDVHRKHRSKCQVIWQSGCCLPGITFLGHRIISWLEIWFCHRGAVSRFTPSSTNKRHALFAESRLADTSLENLILVQIAVASNLKPKLSLFIPRGWHSFVHLSRPCLSGLHRRLQSSCRPKNRLLAAGSCPGRQVVTKVRTPPPQTSLSTLLG